MSELNQQQQAACDCIDKPLLVLAGAGSGKTRVITAKIAHLIRHHGMLAEKIAAITFTNKAAREMRQRSRSLLKGVDSEGLVVSTFHSLGVRLLHDMLNEAGLRPGFSIYDAEDTRRVIADLLPKGSDRALVDPLAQRISWYKGQGMDQDDIGQHEDNPALLEVFEQYHERLRRFNAVDFDDLLYLPVKLLTESKELRLRWQQRFRHLLVDEYQDTNACQYRLLKLLVGDNTPFTAVGDDDQSIYGWRGAQPENLTHLQQDFPRLQVVKLEQNYRSSRNILHAANFLIAKNPHMFEKKLWSALGDGETLRIMVCKDAETEADKVAAEIMRRRMLGQIKHGDFAVLYRGNHQARPLEQALRAANIPYHLSGGLSFFERSEIKDVLAYLRLIANPDDDAALIRIINVPRRGIGGQTIERMSNTARNERLSLFRTLSRPTVRALLTPRAAQATADFGHWIETLRANADTTPAARLARIVVDESGYRDHLRTSAKDPQSAERRNRNIDDLLGWIEQLTEKAKEPMSLQDVLAQLALAGATDDDEPDDQSVRLMTLHAAKGLEFPHVFMVGVEEGQLPHRTSLEEGTETEERRLMYVGITRAQRSLTLSYARSRRRFGETVKCQPSRFLKELPEDVVTWEGQNPDADRTAARARGKAHLDALRQALAKSSED